ncbi:MAG: hypothetical protein ACI9OJ_005563, partial [Myxococcota bacterium]
MNSTQLTLAGLFGPHHQSTTHHELRHLLLAALAGILLSSCGSPLPEPDAPEAVDYDQIESAMVTCAWDVLGSDSTCATPDEFKQMAAAHCGGKSAEVQSVGYANACDSGSWRQAKVTCCGITEQGAPTIEPQDQAPSCEKHTVGAPSECVSATEFKSRAAESCGERSVSQMGFAGACGTGSWHYSKFECCDSVIEPPPACEQNVAGASLVCRSETDWKANLQQVCADSGRDLTNTNFAGSCGDDSWSYAKYSCCASEAVIPTDDPAPKPPGIDPPTAECKTRVFGGQEHCKSANTWKTQAGAFCTNSNMGTANVTYADSCSPGAFRYAQVSCCGPLDASDGPNFDAFGCFSQSVADECKSAPQWREEAALECARHDRVIES